MVECSGFLNMNSITNLAVKELRKVSLLYSPQINNSFLISFGKINVKEFRNLFSLSTFIHHWSFNYIILSFLGGKDYKRPMKRKCEGTRNVFEIKGLTAERNQHLLSLQLNKIKDWESKCLRVPSAVCSFVSFISFYFFILELISIIFSWLASESLLLSFLSSCRVIER